MEWETLLKIADNWDEKKEGNIRGKLTDKLVSIKSDKGRIAYAKLISRTIQGYSDMVCKKIDSDPEGAKKHGSRLFEGCMLMLDINNGYNNYLHYHGQVSVPLADDYCKRVVKYRP